jgi:hypothetical protein
MNSIIMGCCGSKKTIKSNLPNFQKGSEMCEKAWIILEENFKIVDYTQFLNEISEIQEHKDFLHINKEFPQYFPSEIKCVKGRNESRADHSHLVVFFSLNSPDRNKEIGLVTDYSPFGFAITIGELLLLKDLFDLKGAHLELIFFPKSENVGKISLGEILEWAYLHKDEEYKTPEEAYELNMGKRMFRYVSSRLQDDNRA